MKKLLIIICLAAATARIITPMTWETTARTEWKELAAAANSPAEQTVIREIQAASDAQLGR